MDWQQGGMIVGALAVLYGLLVAFGLQRVSLSTRNMVVNGGAIVLLGLLVVLVFLP
ncbi:hypothetical protein [Mobilicoccus caccae]|uniref:Uncharacterized protein n=1 Tax=Mobilicoccus caccae TaxID=1859295 RepID=A0ABQ6IRA7_9MICO|nr:hypothetical protein [Mobilicoccus caccae]GMA39616.1 hypothetical protein GCM10025883_16610 [Mobilicoccus caccae]